MECVDCILCNINDTHLLVKKASFNVVKCNKCDLVFINPRLDQNELNSLYNDDGSLIEEIPGIDQRKIIHDKYKRKKFEIAIKLLRKHEKNSMKIFDLGCSKGIFLDMVEKVGWIPYGSDVNHKQVTENQKRYGDRVKLQAGKRIDCPDQYFDAITLFDSIEHMTEPVDTLREAARVMRNDGVVVVSTPNIDGLFPKLTYFLFGKTIGAWEHPEPPRHVYQFSKKTLSMALKKAGLEVVDYENFENDIPYTVGELENSIVNALKKNDNEEKYLDQNFRPQRVAKSENIGEVKVYRLARFKKIPRLSIRCICWILVVIIYPVARILNKGDSMIVLARKKHHGS